MAEETAKAAEEPTGENWHEVTVVPVGERATDGLSARRRAKVGRKPKAEKAESGGRRLKIAVYAIAKNEAKFAERWMASMREADAVVVLDTGSTDGTADALRALGATVEAKAFPQFRFDEARNESLDLAVRIVPDADLLVCTDLDEFFLAGWRDKLEAAWKDGVAKAKAEGRPEPTTAVYEYVWNFQKDGSDGLRFNYEKVHTPQSGARWTHPVHEVLGYPNGKALVKVDGMRLEHHADPTKSRGQYLPLLEMSVREAPADDRNAHYLGREYMFYRRWDDAISSLKRHLSLPTAKWDAERAQSMRFIGRCWGEKGDRLRQEIWLRRAVDECATQREACLDLAELMNANRDWHALVSACRTLFARRERTMCYVTTPEAWGYRPHDLYSVGLWHTGRYAEAVFEAKVAKGLAPDNARIAENVRVMEEVIARSRG